MEIPKSTMLLFRSFMYTFGEYSWMTRLDSREECHTVLDPIDSEAEIRDLKLRLILLRKYTSPEKRGEDIYALKTENNTIMCVFNFLCTLVIVIRSTSFRSALCSDHQRATTTTINFTR